MVVEVLLAQVGEDRRRERGGVDAALSEGVGRHLHAGGHEPLVAKFGEARLELRRLRRGPGLRQGADRRRPPPVTVEDFGEKGDRGRLAVGSGDADDAQMARRMLPEGIRQRAQRPARRGHHHLRQGEVEHALDDQRRCAGREGGGSEFVPVDARPGNAREQRARCHRARRLTEAADLCRPVAYHARVEAAKGLSALDHEAIESHGALRSAAEPKGRSSWWCSPTIRWSPAPRRRRPGEAPRSRGAQPSSASAC